jgi:hypothetical protein
MHAMPTTCVLVTELSDGAGGARPIFTHAVVRSFSPRPINQLHRFIVSACAVLRISKRTSLAGVEAAVPAMNLQGQLKTGKAYSNNA